MKIPFNAVNADPCHIERKQRKKPGCAKGHVKHNRSHAEKVAGRGEGRRRGRTGSVIGPPGEGTLSTDRT